jgi:UDP-N-acetylmuramoyl-tripeptide--D-alanyl-D-alanine ligase
VELLITVGPLAAAISEGFRGEALQAADAAEAAVLTEREVRPGDVILVKGSRGVGLETVCRALSQAARV